MGSTDRCALAVRAARLLAERQQVRQPPPTHRVQRLQAKLDALVQALTPAERAYYGEQVWQFASRERRQG